MKINLWRGYHSPSLVELLQPSLEGKSLTILCPPSLADYSFLDFLPPGEVLIVGAWPQEELTKAQKKAYARKHQDYSQFPTFGVFTSGTQSLSPRLVLFSKKEVEASLLSIFDLFKDNWTRKIFSFPQPFHIFGLTLGYLNSLIFRKPLFSLEGPYQKSFHDFWKKEQAKGVLTLGAPVHFHDLIQQTKAPLLSYESSSICGGARVSVDLWKKIQNHLGVEFPSIGYGASEACPGLTHLAPGVAPIATGDIGTWLAGVEHKSHPDGFEFKAPNQCMTIIEESSPGNMQVRFPKSILIRDDLIESEGRLFYQGRSDLKMNRGGEKFSLEIIEEKIQNDLKLPVLAIALPDERLGEKLGLLLQSQENKPELLTQCTDLILKEFFWPLSKSQVCVCPQIPTNPNGKWDRKAARNYF